MTEQRSRFLSFAFPCESVEKQSNLLKKMRAEYPSATHICYASAIDCGDIRYLSSDDGEPSGTAGVPILNVLKEKQLVNVIVFVVRYFGGIKLGTSGLFKAYKECAELSLENVVPVMKKKLFKMRCSYENFDKIKKIAGKDNIDDVKFSENVTFLIYLKEDDDKLFLDVADEMEDLCQFKYVR